MSGEVSCVEDRASRTVCVPPGPHHIACDDILCFESVWTVGELPAIEAMRTPTAVWLQLAPGIARIQLFEEPNLEQLLADGVDLAFVYSDTRKLEYYEHAGIAAIVGQSTSRDATDVAHFLAGQKDSLRLYGRVLGAAAETRAQLWAAYIDDKVAYVTARTGRLAPEQRPSAYYLRGPDPLTTHGVRTCPYWYAQLAGVDFVTGGLEGMVNRTFTSAEQLVRWDPELVFVGRLYSPDLLRRDTRFATLRAVQHDRVHALPGGIFFWDGGPEAILLMLWIAKTAHPDLFPELDLTTEVQAYYQRFYDLKLTPQQLANLLAGQGPDGQRTVHIRN
ncbi:MAG: ABC transporter substrate-binding protein [Polyangiales bacterium]